MELDKITQHVLKDESVNYGYYGNKTMAPKRWLWWSRLRLANKIYLKHAAKIKKNNLLDFGCEFGFFSAYLSGVFKKVYLIELYEKFLNEGIEIHKKFGSNNYVPMLNHEQDSGYFTKEIKDKIDLFLFFDVLEHVRNIDTFIKDLRKISTPETYLLISLPTENLFYMFLTKFKREKDHVNRYFEVEKALKLNGWKIVEKKSLLSLFNVYLYKASA